MGRLSTVPPVGERTAELTIQFGKATELFPRPQRRDQHTGIKDIMKKEQVTTLTGNKQQTWTSRKQGHVFGFVPS